MKVKVVKVDNDGDDNFESTSGMVDTCHGDSGGPLACQVPHQNQGHRYVFIAICIAIMIITFITNIPNFFYRQGTGRTSLWGLSTGAVDTVERSFYCYMIYCSIFIFLLYSLLHFYRTQVNLGSDLWVGMSLRQ